MTTAPQVWLDGLRTFAASHRQRKPLAEVAPPTPTQAAERLILAADMSTRLARLHDLLAARSALMTRGMPDIEVDPAVVVTTSAVGIAVVAELLTTSSQGSRPLVAVTELEYRLWCIRQPDEAHRLHINLWSWVKVGVPDQRRAEFARHPLGPGEAYWLHRAGVAGAGAADGRHCHLWKWNGRHATLLQAFVRERTVGHLGVRGDRGGENGTPD